MIPAKHVGGPNETEVKRNMKAHGSFAAALTALTIGAAVVMFQPGTSFAGDRIVECMDGTVFNLDPRSAISGKAACTGHGGVRASSVSEPPRIG